MLLNLENTPAEGRGFEQSLRQNGSHFPLLEEVPPRIAIVDSRVLIRECLARSLESMIGAGSVTTFASLSDLLSAEELCQSASMVILCLDGARSVEAQLKQADQERTEIAKRMKLPPFVYLCEREDVGGIVHALESGVKGYIPTSLTLDVAVKALKLVNAGGEFIPASSLVLAHCALKSSEGPARSPLKELFTERQVEIVEAVRQGKANKTIAHELKMHESTVKVHVRNIMKKLNARNRTQIAFLTEQFFRT